VQHSALVFFFLMCESAVPLTLTATCTLNYLLTYSWVYNFYSNTNQMHSISNLFYFGTTLYMFRTVFPSIIRSLKLYIYLMLYVQSISIVKSTRCTISQFFYFWNNTLHVSDDLFVHHQESKTVHIPNAVCTVYFCSKKPDAQYLNFFLFLEQHCTCFERSLRPSSGV